MKASKLQQMRGIGGRLVRYLKHLPDRAFGTAKNAEVEAIRQRVRRAYQEGFEFHQGAVRSNLGLLAGCLELTTGTIVFRD